MSVCVLLSGKCGVSLKCQSGTFSLEEAKAVSKDRPTFSRVSPSTVDFYLLLICLNMVM